MYFDSNCILVIRLLSLFNPTCGQLFTFRSAYKHIYNYSLLVPLEDWLATPV